ncbi:NHLP leader peptide family RiPP precursor [Scytonema sp. NUACC26]|uniref:NHLP leader peptide family RiPP precursor n=1 Tax=Scytonema sp. NUACC26 TaxID=3140176 RepID=UPI0034DC0E81
MSEQQRIRKTRHEFESDLIAKAWKDQAFKQELIVNAKAVYTKELQQPLPDDLQIQVFEETPSTLYLLIPRNPMSMQVNEELSEEALESVAGGAISIINPPTDPTVIVPYGIVV